MKDVLTYFKLYSLQANKQYNIGAPFKWIILKKHQSLKGRQ